MVSDSSFVIGEPLIIVEAETREEVCNFLGGKKGSSKKEINFFLDDIKKDERWEKVDEKEGELIVFKMKDDASKSVQLLFNPDDPKLVFWLIKSVLMTKS
jgi:hypothetical protein